MDRIESGALDGAIPFMTEESITFIRYGLFPPCVLVGDVMNRCSPGRRAKRPLANFEAYIESKKFRVYWGFRGLAARGRRS
jgi:hypothetical protein